MSRLAILHPTTLLGKEVRELLEDRPQLWTDLRLLSTEDDEIGMLTGVAGAATVVVEAKPDEMAGVDWVFACGRPEEDRPFLDALSPGATAVLLSPEMETGSGRPVVAGVNSDAAEVGSVMLSPHPGSVLLAHLLQPLRTLGLADVAATVIQPTSIYDTAGLDDLFDQTRGILAMKGGDSEMFGRQLAFNLLPARISGSHVSAQVSEILDLPVPVSVQLLQGSVFHGMSVSLHLELSADAGEVRNALQDGTRLEIFEEPDLLGPIDVAAETDVLVGHVTQDRPGSVWIWAVMDNLTRGGALNAVEIAERLLSG